MPEEKNEWEWFGGHYGVHLREAGNLVWYENEGPDRWASGGACVQTYEDFLAKGPSYGEAPPEVLQAVTEAVKKRLTSR